MSASRRSEPAVPAPAKGRTVSVPPSKAAPLKATPAKAAPSKAAPSKAAQAGSVRAGAVRPAAPAARPAGRVVAPRPSAAAPSRPPAEARTSASSSRPAAAPVARDAAPAAAERTRSTPSEPARRTAAADAPARKPRPAPAAKQAPVEAPVPAAPVPAAPAPAVETSTGGPGPTGRPRPALPEPAALTAHGPARVIAVCNQKGGVGKTTSTINLGASLAAYGRRVLLVDFDPQGALAVGLGVNPGQLERTVYDVLVDRHTDITDVLLPTAVPGMDLLPANIDLSGAELHLSNEVAREQTLQRALAPVLDHYDVVLIDCQPSLGLLTVNALTAADSVIIPLECEYFALRGVALLTEIIDKVRDRLNPRLEIEGILATMFDARTVHGRQVLERVVEAFGDKVFHTVINRTVRFPETTVVGQPITVYAPTSAGADAYRDLARELLARQRHPAGS